MEIGVIHIALLPVVWHRQVAGENITRTTCDTARVKNYRAVPRLNRLSLSALGGLRLGLGVRRGVRRP